MADPIATAALSPSPDSVFVDDLLPTCRAALSAAEALIATARGAVEQVVSAGGRVDAAKLDANQFAAHGYAWYATYSQALRQILAWAERLEASGRLGTLEQLILQAAYGEYLAQMTGGIAMSQVEIVRPGDLGIDDESWHAFYIPEVARLISGGNSAAVRAAIADVIADGTMPDSDLDDEMLVVVRDQFRRFSDERIAPDAQDWHREDRLIPDAVVAEMAELGVFGLTVPEAWGGSGMGKVAMCVVTEELCRGSLAVGSLATRSEIAAELIRVHGTAAQKERWLGEINVLGYRGMKEYEIAFDGFEVPADCLLGAKEGEGFKQLMATFESARIQTAARATGVAQSAFELGLAYAQDRKQFGRAIYQFPRVSGKLAWMLVETMVARQLTWYAAREKDAGHRCDLEAGMAKLLAARVAWASADNAVQIHGGNGYAEEYPVSRVLVDSRILNVFEGAAEIQAHIIARRLLGGN